MLDARYSKDQGYDVTVYSNSNRSDYDSMLNYTILHDTTICCIALYYIILHYTMLYYYMVQY